MSNNIHLISRWFVKDGFQTEAEQMLQHFEKMAKSENGTLMYFIHRPMWNPDLISRPTPQQLEVLFFEVYENKSAFKKHVKNQVDFLKEVNGFRYFQTPADNPQEVASMVEFLNYERGFIKSTLKTK